MYTKDDKELNPREKQVEKPKNPEELSLALTTECYKYLADRGEKFETYAEIISALLPNPIHAQNYEKPINALQLQRKVKYIVEVYVARDRKNPHKEQQSAGAIDITKSEFTRRMLNLFLNDKIMKNGDIFPKPIEHSGLYEDVAINNSNIETMDAEIKEIKTKLEELLKYRGTPAYEEK